MFAFQIETIVNPFKSGMRTIKNMPDTLVGGTFVYHFKIYHREHQIIPLDDDSN